MVGYLVQAFLDSSIHSFVYTVSDGHGKNSTATVYVTVLYYPTAFDDYIEIFMNESIEIDLLEHDIL